MAAVRPAGPEPMIRRRVCWLDIAADDTRSPPPLPRPRAAPRLRLELHIDDAHAAIDGLAHVVDRQGGDGDRGQRLHLDAGPVEGAHGGADGDARAAPV